MQNNQIVFLCIIMIIAGFILGYMIGFGSAVHAFTKIANNFIDIDYDTVYKALFQYNEKITMMGDC